MKSKETTERSSQGLPSGSAVLDLIFLSILSLQWLLSYSLFPSNPFLVILLPVLAAAATFFAIFLRPVLASATVDALPDGVVLPGRTALLTGVRDIRTVDLIFARYILVPQYYLNQLTGRRRGELLHEIGHIECGDARFFVIATPLLAANLTAAFVLFAGVSLGYFEGSKILQDVIALFGAGDVGSWLFLTVIGPTALFFVLYLVTVRDREYSADTYARGHDPDAIRSFLENRLSQKKYTRPQSFVSQSLAALTHPSAESRLKSLSQEKSLLGRPSLLSGFLFYYLPILALWYILTLYSHQMASELGLQGVLGQALRPIAGAYLVAGVLFILAYCGFFSLIIGGEVARGPLLRTLGAVLLMISGAYLGGNLIVFQLDVLIPGSGNSSETGGYPNLERMGVPVDSSYEALLRFPLGPIVLMTVFWMAIRLMLGRVIRSFAVNVIVGFVAILMPLYFVGDTARALLDGLVRTATN